MRYPIDLVITYVNSEDKVWKSQYITESIKQKRKVDLQSPRYRDWGTLKYLLRGVAQYMPWINKIYLIVQQESQVPDWLDTNRINVVYHKDIIPEDLLPTYNSNTIEMYMYRIPGLSEHFIYANDDTFPFSKLYPYHFFDEYGYPRLNQTIVPYNESYANIYEHILRNSEFIAREDLRIKYYDSMTMRSDHSINPMLKSTWNKLHFRYGDRFKKACTQFRDKTNISQEVVNNYQYLSKEFGAKNINTKYFEFDNEQKYGTIQKLFNDTSIDIACINDTYNTNIDLHIKELISEFNKKFSIRSIYEKSDEKFYKYTTNLDTLNNTKIALCAIAKNENKYIREWVEYYKNLGISKIFLYDNNDIYGERFEDVINDYIESGFVDIIDKRGIIQTTDTDVTGDTLQGKCYKDCLINNINNYEWIMFFDIDEFLCIVDKKKYKDIYSWLSDPIYKDYTGIQVQWRMYGDANQIKYKNDSVIKRFKKKSNEYHDIHTKYIVKCKNILNISITDIKFCAHGLLFTHNKSCNKLSRSRQNCNILGYITNNIYKDIKIYDNLPVYLDHFYSKSTEEFMIRKYNKTSAVTGINKNRNYNKEFLLKQYFEHNKKTNKKLKFIDSYVKDYNKQCIKSDLIVSFTTFPERKNVIEQFLENLEQQTIKPSKIYCWLYDKEYDYKIPDYLQRFVDDNVIDIRWTNTNTYGHKRYEVFKEHNDKYIILIDDDILYPKTYFEELYNAMKQHPNNVIDYLSCTVDYIDGFKHFLDYTNEPVLNNYFLSGLSAFPPNTFPIKSFNFINTKNIISIKDDDSWINAWLIKTNTKIIALHKWAGSFKFIDKNLNINLIENSQIDTLYKNHNGKINMIGYQQKTINIMKCLYCLDIDHSKIFPNLLSYENYIK